MTGAALVLELRLRARSFALAGAGLMAVAAITGYRLMAESGALFMLVMVFGMLVPVVTSASLLSGSPRTVARHGYLPRERFACFRISPIRIYF